MSSKNPKIVWMVAGIALLIALLGAAGCQKERAASLPTAQGNAAVSEGRKVFAANDCVNCHGINAQGGPKGPDLTHTGAKPGHTFDWFITYIVKPRALNPASRMPPHPGLSRKDLLALAGYLDGLK